MLIQHNFWKLVLSYQGDIFSKNEHFWTDATFSAPISAVLDQYFSKSTFGEIWHFVQPDSLDDALPFYTTPIFIAVRNLHSVQELGNPSLTASCGLIWMRLVLNLFWKIENLKMSSRTTYKKIRSFKKMLLLTSVFFGKKPNILTFWKSEFAEIWHKYETHWGLHLCCWHLFYKAFQLENNLKNNVFYNNQYIA